MSQMAAAEVIAGRYRIAARIGSGGMGEVFRARDTTLGRTVALKVLSDDLAARPGFVERFRAEAQAAARLSHPNVVQVHDWGSADGSYFMVMEYVRGRNLHEILAVRGALEPAQAAAVIDQLLSALQAAHASGVVHRDIKPENVMVTMAGEVKVTDFGIARMTDASATGETIGTAMYASPEQIRGEAVDGRADLYSAGCVAYELLCGAPPFEGNVAHVLHQHLNGRVPDPSVENPEAAPLDAVVCAATQADPDQRYPTAGAMRAALGRVAAYLPPAPPLAELVAELTSEVSVQAQQLTAIPVPARLRGRHRLSRGPDQPPGGGPRRSSGRRSGRSPEEPSGSTSGGSRKWPWLVCALLVMLVVAAFLLVRPVPKVVGMDSAAAGGRVQGAGMHATIQQVFSDAVHKGTVVADRTSGIAVAGFGLRGAMVTLVVSKGPDLVQLPNEVGVSLTAAEAAIQSTGLPVAQVVQAYSPTVPSGTVITQLPSNPSGPIAERPGTLVNLTVSKGQQMVMVPPVATGTAYAAAIGALQQVGLTAAPSYAYSSAVSGTVLGQSPAPGTSVAIGGPVTVNVSKGPAPFAMPAVIGESCAAAQGQLTTAGLVVSVVNTSGGTACGAGKVLEQDPVAGISVSKSSTATLYIP